MPVGDKKTPDQGTILHGHEPAPPSLPSRSDFRATLIELINNDPGVRAALAAVAPVPVEPDAALAAWVMDLIETKLRQHVRPDAFRRQV